MVTPALPLAAGSLAGGAVPSTGAPRGERGGAEEGRGSSASLPFAGGAAPVAAAALVQECSGDWLLRCREAARCSGEEARCSAVLRVDMRGGPALRLRATHTPQKQMQHSLVGGKGIGFSASLPTAEHRQLHTLLYTKAMYQRV